MRTAFNEYYALTEKETDKLWKEGLIVFDTNVLLKLYQLSHEAQNEILSAMKGYKERLWLPHQVGYEYHERRLEKATAPIETLQGLEKRIEDFENNIKNLYSNNPFLDFRKLESVMKSFKTKVSKLSLEWLKECPNPINEDDILESLTKLFDGKVGNEYDESQLAAIYKEGNDRYGKSVPPGYKDTGKPGGDRHRFGDLIIWLQIIEQSKKEDKDVIFVTDDCKEDWWSVYKEDKIGPRRELIREFRKETNNHLIWFYTTGRFLRTAKTKLGASVKAKTIDEVKRQALNWTAFMGGNSEPGQISWSSFGLQHALGLDESDPYGVGQTAKLITEANEKIQNLTKPLAALFTDADTKSTNNTSDDGKPVNEESKGE